MARYSQHETLNSEAAVAGWISSTDVTLICVVMLLATGIAVKARLSQTEAQLRTVTSRFEMASQSLVQVQKLQAANATLSSENRSLKELVGTDKGGLSSRIEEMEKAQVQQAALRADLEARLVAAEESRKKLLAELQASQKELADTVLTLEQARKEISRQEIDLANLKEHLAEYAGLSQMSEAWEEEKRQLQKKVALLDANLATEKMRFEKAREVFKRMKATEEANIRLVSMNDGLEAEIASLQSSRDGNNAKEGAIRAELLGLQGKFERVAILMDVSGSMANSGWEETKAEVSTWLSHLVIDECIFIPFSTNARVFKVGESAVLPLQGPDGEKNRSKILAHLDTLSPEGTTFTRDALIAAYSYEPTSIILFTDGAPNDGRASQFQPEEAQKIFELCREHKAIPINTVALGDYLTNPSLVYSTDPSKRANGELSTFLKTVSQLTGGKFQGR